MWRVSTATDEKIRTSASLFVATPFLGWGTDEMRCLG
ncbi:hypothetical protein HEP81_08022 (plasmid) [Streptomyces griseofuscus]|uniref:Uncharacterized protein n=1 Tax=Streptomyces griseofuscus TaxID=146922 RepID=A0A7H1QD70_9ACTN|nr:hypothetical protein HEP81_08022 [Streptomyces griseofuscus]